MKEQPYDIDADTGTVRPQRINPNPAPLNFSSIEINPKLATTVTLIALGFFGCLLWQAWQDGSLTRRGKKF